jgi:uncharacterized protein (TIGR02757 family)
MTNSISPEIAELLLSEAKRINSPDFIAADPVQFPRRFTELADVEIVSLLAAHLAWGNRKMICRDTERLLALMDMQPHRYVMDCGYEELPDEINIHRTFFGRNLKHMLRGLRAIYQRHGSLDAFCRACGAPQSDYPSWHLAAAINAEMAAANGGETDSRCLPLNLESTALKRLNMALRWLVRRDGIVDMGLWTSLTPAQLFIPLDVHVGDTARELGLVTRRANDRRTTVELTETLRTLRPDDPVYFDYALFGIPTYTPKD